MSEPMTAARLAEWEQALPNLRKAAHWLQRGGQLAPGTLTDIVLMLDAHLPDLVAEVARLRAELVRVAEHNIAMTQECQIASADIDRVHAENERLQAELTECREEAAR